MHSSRENQKEIQVPFFYVAQDARLHLHLGQTMLPDGDIGGDTVLTVVKEDDPAAVTLACAPR